MSARLAEVFPVGEILADELEARGWTQTEFAEILGRPAQFVSEIISGKKEITRDSAAQIASALGTEAQFWLNLQDSYYLWRQAQDKESQGRLADVRLRARLKDLAPISVLRQRGLIKGMTPREQEGELKHLYGISNIYDDPEVLVAARRSKPDEKVSSTQLAWIACARVKAEAIDVKPFDSDGLQALAERLPNSLDSAEQFVNVPSRFSSVGVRLVYLEAFPSSKMDGCSFLLDDGRPAIAISGRGKRLDKVLFTLLHEVAHVVCGHLDQENQEYIIDDREQGQGPTLGLEQPADEMAAHWVLPRGLPRLPDRINQGWVNQIATENGIHPIVLIGRLQNEHRIPWKSTLVKDAPTVISQLERW